MSVDENQPHYVYRVYDPFGDLIYIGCSIDVPSRMSQHYSQAWWGPQAAKVKAKVYPNRFTGRRAESEAIRTERPRWNSTGRGPRNTWTEQDYVDYITTRRNGPYADSSSCQRSLERLERQLEALRAVNSRRSDLA